MKMINTDVYKIGHFTFDFPKMILNHNKNKQNLTHKETDLLKLLFINKNNVLTREFMPKTIWGDDNYFSGMSMDVYISKLRKYLKSDENISIVSIHGIGFKLEFEKNKKNQVI